MLSRTAKKGAPTPAPPAPGAGVVSPGLEWVWQFLRDVRRPHILDCGMLRRQTVNTLLRRGAKVYLSDLLTPLLADDPPFWDRSGKTPAFLIEEFLGSLPHIPPETLTGILAWQLPDLVPRTSLPPLIDRLFSLLQPDGVLFCVLRQPYLEKGADTTWELDRIHSLATKTEGTKPFPYAVIPNREFEPLFPPGRVKTFLTRSGRREIVALK